MNNTPPQLTPILEHASLRAAADHLGKGEEAAIAGAIGSSTHLAAAAFNRLTGRPVLLITAHADDAEHAADEFRSMDLGCIALPALEVLPGETAAASDLFADRVEAVRAATALTDERPPVVVAPIQALMQAVPTPDMLPSFLREVRVGDELDLDALTSWLSEAGYIRTESVEEPGQFAVRGGILDILPPEGAGRTLGKENNARWTQLGSRGIRLDLFGDEIDAAWEIDLDTMGSDRALHAARLVAFNDAALDRTRKHGINFLDTLPTRAVAVLGDTLEVTEQARGYYERVIDDTGIFAPAATLKSLRERFHAFAEFNPDALAIAATADIAGYELPLEPVPEFARDAATAAADLGTLTDTHRVIVIAQREAELSRLNELLDEFAKDARRDRIETHTGFLHRGFVIATPNAETRRTLVLPYDEFLHRFNTNRGRSGSGRKPGDERSSLAASSARDAFLELNVGDTVVHADHGIARFTGLTRMAPKSTRPSASESAEEKFARHVEAQSDIGNTRRNNKRRAKDTPDEPVEEFLTLEFAKGAKLHVPATQVDKVQKYVGAARSGARGSGRAQPTLSTLGGKRWQSQKDSVKESVKDLAGELLRVQAARDTAPGTRFPADTPWQTEFEAEFPFQETEDQLSALVAIKRDMSEPTPMDRLLCGDVGFGKTELAVRAAFKAAEFGKQVAVLVPTTVLAEQHERTFRSRMADYPFTVESVSRFKTRAEQNDILKRTRQGQVDILVGTHRILSKDVKFADLGLVVIDEEQRFGVEHKNRLLELRMTADVLTLSATPIPRTLHMSMLGLRDISSLTTAPQDRRAVVTEVIPYNNQRIKAAIQRELSRRGQVFFLHNRVHNINTVADDIQKLAPDARVAIGHGQMPERELERVMRDFLNRNTDILVSTTIIESGIDIPSANTMFINDAHRFGLAELHQLRGRVGRYKHRAYCYLLLPQGKSVPEVARKRLRAIEEFSMLGAGFKISMRDLEIRGAGNILGAEQSGHIAAVGYDMYCQLLEQASRELQGERITKPSETTIEIGMPAAIPKRYIPSDPRRLDAYRRIATAETPAEIDRVEHDLRAAYGEPPKPAERLLDLARLRTAAALLGVRSIAAHDRDVILRTAEPETLTGALEGIKGTIRTLSNRAARGDDLTQVFYRPPETRSSAHLEPQTLLNTLKHRLVKAAAERAERHHAARAEKTIDHDPLDESLQTELQAESAPS